MITFGLDPEFMLKDSDGNLKSAIGVVAGTKENRLSLGDGHAIYYDNVLCEVQIRPASSKNEIVDSIRQCLTRAAKIVHPLRLTTQASATYPMEECQHKDAFVFGCDPEFCAYLLQVIDPPVAEGTFRSGGGHIHIGFEGGANIVSNDPQKFEEENFAVTMNRLWVVRMADLLIGIPSLFLDKDPTSKERRKLYGGAGSHRACDNYGVEYRSLSNFWLSRPSLVELMFDLATASWKVVMDKRKHEEIWEKEINPETVRLTINNWDMDEAKKLIKVAEKHLPAKVKKELHKEIDKPWSDDVYAQWGIKH